jgi:glycosyltransferase involved in cell wall biosynthesis
LLKTLQILGHSKYGGATYLVVEWCEYLLANGWQVDVLTTDQLTNDRLKRLEGINVIDNIFIPREIVIFKLLKALFSLLSLLKNKKYDVVHTYSATPSVIGRFAAWISKVEKIFHHQAGWTTVEADKILTKRFFQVIENLAALFSTLSICVSHSVYKQGVSEKLAPKKKLTVICNGIDPSPFILQKNDSIKDQVDIPIESIIIGSTGRLAPQKDLETFIHSFDLLLLRNPKKEIFLFLAGSGDHEDELKKIVKKLNLQSKIIFLGFYEDIPTFLANIDIFVSSSLREGLSISVMEAMAAAKPIIVSSIAPNIELIEDGVNGLTFPPGDHIALAKALGKLIEDKESWQKYGEAAREKLIKEYSIDRMFSETYALYRPEKL